MIKVIKVMKVIKVIKVIKKHGDKGDKGPAHGIIHTNASTSLELTRTPKPLEFKLESREIAIRVLQLVHSWRTAAAEQASMNGY